MVMVQEVRAHIGRYCMEVGEACQVMFVIPMGLSQEVRRLVLCPENTVCHGDTEIQRL